MFALLVASELFFFSLKEKLGFYTQERTSLCDLQVYLQFFYIENCQIRGLK